MDAEVLEGFAEVGDVRLELAAEHLPGNEGEGKSELFRGWEDQWTDGRDVSLERIPSDGHEVLVQVDADDAVVVLLLEHARVRAILRAGERAYDVL
jgi:hypothetical protein